MRKAVPWLAYRPFVVTAYLLGRDVVRSGSKVYPSIGVDTGQDKENACRGTGSRKLIIQKHTEKGEDETGVL